MSRVARLWIVFSLNISLIGALVVVGVVAHSLGVLAEGADYLADAAGICVALFAISLSNRTHDSGAGSRYPNATKWAALVNGVWLLVLTVLVSAGPSTDSSAELEWCRVCRYSSSAESPPS